MREKIELQLAYTKAALAEWQQVVPENVLPGLYTWRCGTQSCFGGTLPTMPSFSFVAVTVDGAPFALADHFEGTALAKMARTYATPKGNLVSWSLSLVLFGSNSLFDPAESCRGETAIHSHALVTQRLANQIGHLEQELESFK